MTDLLERASQSSLQEVEKLEGQLERLRDAKEKDVEEIRETESALARARHEYEATTIALTEMNEGLVDQRNDLEALGGKYDMYTEKLERAEDKLADIIQQRQQYKDSVTGQFSDIPDLNKDTGLEEFINSLKYANADADKFREVMRDLRDMGLSDSLYEEFVASGTAILPFLEELREGGEESVEIVNDMTRGLEAEARRMGNTAARELYKSGQQAAEGLVEGLKSKRAAVEEQMAAIARSIRDILELQLQIKSPSRVMHKLGRFAVEGLARGLKDSASDVENAAGEIGDSALEAMRQSISEMNDLISLDPNMHPTITPVLDLSSFRKEARQISATMSGQQISIGSAYSQAKNASLGYEANMAARDVTTTAGDEMSPADIQFVQNNYSPKALSTAEIYRRTNNQLSVAKGALTPNVAPES